MDGSELVQPLCPKDEMPLVLVNRAAVYRTVVEEYWSCPVCGYSMHRAIDDGRGKKPGPAGR